MCLCDILTHTGSPTSHRDEQVCTCTASAYAVLNQQLNQRSPTRPRPPHFYSPDKFNSQAQICYTAGAVLFHQDILTFQVTVGNSGFALSTEDLGMQVAQATDGGVSQF